MHQRHRLGILTITAEAQRAEFGYLREALGLTPGNLSRHLTVLEEAGMIQVEKGYAGRRPRTWVRITPQGRAALAAELAALTELLRRHTASRGPDKQSSPDGTLHSDVADPEHRTIIRYTFTSSPAVHNQRDWAGMCAPPKSGGNHAA